MAKEEINVQLDESYLVTIVSNFNGVPLTTVVPSRKELAKFLALLDNEKWALAEMSPLKMTVKYEELLLQLINENKPIGQENGN